MSVICYERQGALCCCPVFTGATVKLAHKGKCRSPLHVSNLLQLPRPPLCCSEDSLLGYHYCGELVTYWKHVEECTWVS